MLTGQIKAKLVAFVVVALVATSYLGARYVGIDPFSRDFNVTVALPNAGGSFNNGEVTYRGVPIGRIHDLRATKDGAEATLRISADAPPIPVDADIRVTNRSAIGEQYIDLSGGSSGAETLGEGDRIVAGAESQPPAVEELLRSGREFIKSVPEEALKTVIDEGYDATQGAADGFSRLLENSQDFHEVTDKNFLMTSALIENADQVLSTQIEASDSIRSFSEDLNTIAETLESSDGNLRQLIESAPAAAREFDRLFSQVGRPLGLLMGNLITPAQVFGINAGGVEDALIRAPEAVSVGWAVSSSAGLNMGLAQTFFDPLPCTSGYGGTTVREGLDDSEGEPFNLNAGCSLNPSSGVNVRGPNSVVNRFGAPIAANINTVDSLSDLLGGNS